MPLGADRADDLDQLRDLGSVRPPATSSSSSSRGPVARALATSSRLRGSRPSRSAGLLASPARPVRSRLAGGARVAGPAPQAGALLDRDEHVLEHGHRAEGLAAPGTSARCRGGTGRPASSRVTGCPAKRISPGRRREVARDEAEQAGLARAVRPDDARRCRPARRRATDRPRPRPGRSSCETPSSSSRAVPAGSGIRWLEVGLDLARPGSASCPRPSSRTGTCRSTSSTARRPG